MQATDRRVRRTRNLLREALIELVLEKGYENVTIQDVTDRADIGYRTFFRHYADVDELLLDMVHETLGRLEELLKLPQPSSNMEPFPPAFGENGEILFKFVQDNQDVFKVLLLGRGVRFCLVPISEHAQLQASSILSRFAGKGIPVEIAANHLVTSLFSLMRWWLANDMPYSPAEMGEIAAKLIMQPTWQVLGAQKTSELSEINEWPVGVA